jgi:hypothetical protein
VKPIEFGILVLLACIVGSLAKGLFHMHSGPEHSTRLMQALTVRVALSVGLFVLLLVGWLTGALEPHALGG